jgi:hypothetical protein
LKLSALECIIRVYKKNSIGRKIMDNENEALKQFKFMADALSIKSMETIEKALSFPDTDEVREELGAFFKEKVVEASGTFFIKDKNTRYHMIVQLLEDGTVDFKKQVTPDLTILIGKYYKKIAKGDIHERRNGSVARD